MQKTRDYFSISSSLPQPVFEVPCSGIQKHKAERTGNFIASCIGSVHFGAFSVLIFLWFFAEVSMYVLQFFFHREIV